MWICVCHEDQCQNNENRTKGPWYRIASSAKNYTKQELTEYAEKYTNRLKTEVKKATSIFQEKTSPD